VIQVAQPIDHESGILLTRQSFASCEGNTHGFIYSAGAFSTMNAGARDTFLTRIQNGGNCIDSLDESHGFIGRSANLLQLFARAQHVHDHFAPYE
jgi:hypothetical protein